MLRRCSAQDSEGEKAEKNFEKKKFIYFAIVIE